MLFFRRKVFVVFLWCNIIHPVSFNNNHHHFTCICCCRTSLSIFLASNITVSLLNSLKCSVFPPRLHILPQVVIYLVAIPTVSACVTSSQKHVSDRRALTTVTVTSHYRSCGHLCCNIIQLVVCFCFVLFFLSRDSFAKPSFLWAITYCMSWPCALKHTCTFVFCVSYFSSKKNFHRWV